MHPSYAVSIWLLYMLPAARERVRSVCYKVTGRCFNVTGSDSEEGENMENGKICIRTQTQRIERETLSSFAALSENTRGREVWIPECDLRTPYQRDRDKVIHCKAFRRLKQKYQT